MEGVNAVQWIASIIAMAALSPVAIRENDIGVRIVQRSQKSIDVQSGQSILDIHVEGKVPWVEYFVFGTQHHWTVMLPEGCRDPVLRLQILDQSGITTIHRLDAFGYPVRPGGQECH